MSNVRRHMHIRAAPSLCRSWTSRGAPSAESCVGLATLSVLLIDQLSKAWALRHLSSAEVVDVVFSLRFNLAFNTGMAFSKGAGKGPLIGLVALLVAGVLLFIARKSTSILQLVFIGIVVGGAVSYSS